MLTKEKAMTNIKTELEIVPELQSISNKYQQKFPQLYNTLSEIESKAREKYLRNKGTKEELNKP